MVIHELIVIGNSRHIGSYPKKPIVLMSHCELLCTLQAKALPFNVSRRQYERYPGGVSWREIAPSRSSPHFHETALARLLPVLGKTTKHVQLTSLVFFLLTSKKRVDTSVPPSV